ncbi:MAG: hypothetical protein ACKVPJ_13485 [Chitinophagales bacterium]
MKLLRQIQETSLDKISKFLDDPDNPDTQLSPKLREELLYLDMADNLITRWGALNPTPKLLLTRINTLRTAEGKKPFSVQTIYNYINDAQTLFGSKRRLNKPYWVYTMVMKNYELFLAACKNGDVKGRQMASKEMRLWGGFNNNENEIRKEDIGEKNQVLIINTPTAPIGIDLDETFKLPVELLEYIQTALNRYNNDQMFDKLAKMADDAEYTSS